jgi:tRNA(fMet)-specific endonuclease VapC
MLDSIMLDSSVAIELLEGNGAAHSWILQFSRLELSVVSIAELHFGAINSAYPAAELVRLDSLVADCVVVELDSATAVAYAELKLDLQRIGKRIPENDLWIAASCFARGLKLASIDRHHLWIARLSVVHW